MSMGVAGENNIITLLLIAIMLYKQRERWSQFSKQNVQFSHLLLFSLQKLIIVHKGNTKEKMFFECL